MWGKGELEFGGVLFQHQQKNILKSKLRAGSDVRVCTVE